MRVPPFLVKTRASFPSRMEPDLKPLPKTPMGHWLFFMTLSVKPKLQLHKKKEIRKVKEHPKIGRLNVWLTNEEHL